jgi:hypothetical protein
MRSAGQAVSGTASPSAAFGWPAGSLPVPRILHLLADLTVWLVIVLPGVAFAMSFAMSCSWARGPWGASA